MNIVNGVGQKKYWMWSALSFSVILMVVLIPWASIPGMVVTLQRQLHSLLSEHISHVAASPWQYGTSLILISFLYGVFHAIGPGHGKVIIAGYLGTQRSERIGHGVKISFLASLLQAVVAIVLVTGIAQLLYLSPGIVRRYGTDIEMASYILIILLGGMICLRAWLHLYRKRHLNTFSHLAAEKHACGCQHGYLSGSRDDMKQRALVILSMGLRPCTGALIVLMYAYMVNVYVFGVVAVLAMGIGTGLAVALLACLTVIFRDRLVKWVKRNDESRGRIYPYLDSGLMLFGGLMLMVLGVSLLMMANTIPPHHPLL